MTPGPQPEPSSDVLLVSMPWESVARPSLALGILSSLARRAGQRCTCSYANLNFASAVGPELYLAFAETLELFPLGEHLFACDIFGPAALESDAYLASFGSKTDDRDDPLRRLRDVAVPEFLTAAADQILASGVSTVGFTCTFNQVLPSLALARRLKKCRPELTIIFGGASVHGDMGLAYIEAFPQWIDYVFLGEADESFVEWLAGDRARAHGIPGVAGHLGHSDPVLPSDLDASPIPDFSEFFENREAIRSSSTTDLPEVRHLPYESSRGCWWGQKKHCTFCGLNNLGMRYRRRSVDRIVSELSEQSRRYGVTAFMAADNILDFRAYKTLLEAVAALPTELDLFYEIKSNIHRDDVARLRDAGVWRVQPGIESFSDHVLDLMRKGVSGLRNVQLLKWAYEFGITVEYNVLVGFPGETPEDYEELLRVICSIAHLPPPNGAATEVRVDRFSPFFDHPEELGIKGLRPAAYYRHLIPESVVEPSRYAYFFDRDVGDLQPLRPYIEQVNETIARWKRSDIHKRARLGAGFVEVQSYDGGAMRRQVLRGADAGVFMMSDGQVGIRRLVRSLTRDGYSEDEVRASVQRLTDAGILLRVGDNVVNVIPFAVPHTEGQIAAWADLNGFTSSPPAELTLIEPSLARSP